MNIALIIEHFDPTRGGAERFAVWLAEQLAIRGHSVHVLCHDARARINRYRAATHGASHDADRAIRAHGIPDYEPPKGVTVHRFKGVKLSTGVGFRLFGLRARRWCAVHKPDVVHSISAACAGDLYHPEAGSYAGLHKAAIDSRLTRSQAVMKRLMLGLSGKARTLLDLERKATRSPADGGAWKIVCISPMMVEEFQRTYGLPAARLVRLDNPRMDPMPDLADVPQLRAWFREHYNLTPTEPVALFIGHDFRRKGLWWAIQAIAQTQAPWKLLVVGLGKVRPYMELVDRLKLAHRVRFVGPTRDTKAVYAASDALLLPTFYDSFGFVAVEALSFGLPVVSTRTLGCYPLVTDNHVGTIVDSPRDVADMARALDNLPRSGPALEALARRARAAAAGISPESFMTQLLALYKECVAHKKRHKS